MPAHPMTNPSLPSPPGRRPPGRALWELTRRCDLRCSHCLVDGGPGHRDELDTNEALELVDQLAELGVRYVTLSGGEPLLRPDWLDVARRIRTTGMVFRLSTNGNLLDEGVLEQLLELETEQVLVSLDGPREVHDRIRKPAHSRMPSSHEQVLRVLALLRETPIDATVITSVFRPNLALLPATQDLIAEAGADRWIVQLAHATGRLRGGEPTDDGGLLLAPAQMEQLAAVLLELVADPKLPPRVFNSIGYLSREEPTLRPAGRKVPVPYWKGCRCGVSSVGIEPDGGIKGCANQVGEPFVVGNVRDEPLRVIWDDLERWHWLQPRPEQMTGACQDCALALVCGAGCTALSYAATGELFNNPYCLRAVRGETGR